LTSLGPILSHSTPTVAGSGVTSGPWLGAFSPIIGESPASSPDFKVNVVQEQDVGAEGTIKKPTTATTSKTDNQTTAIPNHGFINEGDPEQSLEIQALPPDLVAEEGISRRAKLFKSPLKRQKNMVGRNEEVTKPCITSKPDTAKPSDTHINLQKSGSTYDIDLGGKVNGIATMTSIAIPRTIPKNGNSKQAAVSPSKKTLDDLFREKQQQQEQQHSPNPKKRKRDMINNSDNVEKGIMSDVINEKAILKKLRKFKDFSKLKERVDYAKDAETSLKNTRTLISTDKNVNTSGTIPFEESSFQSA